MPECLPQVLAPRINGPFPKKVLAEPFVVTRQTLLLDYPGHYEVRRVSRDGGVRSGNRRVYVSQVLAELDVGLKEIDDGLWNV